MEHYHPESAQTPFKAKGAILTGAVQLGASSSVWYNAVLRADGAIRIGDFSNVQDLTMIHCDPQKELHIGNYVTIGHQAILHNKKIGDNTLIGMGAILLEDVEIGSNCLIGAGSLVTQGTIIGDNEVWFGSPAKYRRAITEAEIKSNHQAALHYAELAKEHRKHEL